MGKIVSLFTSPRGRIGRADFWKGAIVIIIGLLVLSWLAIVLGFSTQQSVATTTTVDGETTRQFVGTRWQVSGWASLLIYLLAAVPFTMLAIKRRHDRDFSGADVIGFLALQLLISLAVALGFNGDWLFALLFIQFVWSIILFIVLGCLRGTPGRNKYGDDPLTVSAP